LTAAASRTSRPSASPAATTCFGWWVWLGEKVRRVRETFFQFFCVGVALDRSVSGQTSATHLQDRNAIARLLSQLLQLRRGGLDRGGVVADASRKDFRECRFFHSAASKRRSRHRHSRGAPNRTYACALSRPASLCRRGCAAVKTREKGRVQMSGRTDGRISSGCAARQWRDGRVLGVIERGNRKVLWVGLRVRVCVMAKHWAARPMPLNAPAIDAPFAAPRRRASLGKTVQVRAHPPASSTRTDTHTLLYPDSRSLTLSSSLSCPPRIALALSRVRPPLPIAPRNGASQEGDARAGHTRKPTHAAPSEPHLHQQQQQLGAPCVAPRVSAKLFSF